MWIGLILSYVFGYRLGLTRPSRGLVRHVLRNSLLPLVTMLGMDVGLAVGGAIFTETIFDLPGLGH